MTPGNPVRLIAVDWGSSRLRVSALDGDGGTVRVAASPDGILVTPSDQQRARLLQALAPFRETWRGVPIVAGGMIGSRNGLTETVPVPVPAGLSDIARAMRPLVIDAATTLHITPGITDETAHPRDLIRGEEVQVAGWLAKNPAVRDAILILPGTHSKWVWVEDRRIASFRTFLTGELYGQVLGSPSFSGMGGRPPTAEVATDPALRDGVVRGFAAGGLLHDLFATRSRSLSAGAGFDVGHYLSGLLVGYEIAEARARGLLPAGHLVALLSEGALQDVYLAALTQCGIVPQMTSGDLFGLGVLNLFTRYIDQRPKESL